MRALSQRPDLVVSLAKVRAAEDKIKAIKASYFPKINALANVGYGEERGSVGSAISIDTSALTYGASLGFELQVFDGFLRDRSLQAARAELQAANEELETMNEELQSTNDELYTINDTLRERSVELDDSKSFVESLVNSIHLGLLVVDREMRVPLAKMRRIDQQQATTINWLLGADHSPLETTIAYEQVAIEVTAAVAQNE
ncbi:TolC family protein, partial [Lacticaseibacillus rhamnosus]